MARVLPLTRFPPFGAQSAAFAVMEIHPVWGGVPGTPGRALLCEVEDGEALSLERDAPAPDPRAPVAALAPDDHQTLRKLLQESIHGQTADREAAIGDYRVRLYRVGALATAGRIRRALEEVPLRPLQKILEGIPVAVFPLSDPALHFAPIHRAIRGVDTFKPEIFLTVVREYARIQDIEASLLTPSGISAATELLGTLSTGFHAVLLVLKDGRGKLLRFKRSMSLTSYPAVPRNPTLRSLDLALVEALVLKTVLGIQQPERAEHPNVFVVDSIEETVRAVDEGKFQAGFVLNPPPMWELRAVIEAAQQLPPRTLKVSPIPPAGLMEPASST